MPTKTFGVMTAMVPCYTANSKFKLHPLADVLNIFKSSNPIVELFEQAVGVSTVNGVLSKHMSCVETKGSQGYFALFEYPFCHNASFCLCIDT